MAIMIMFAFIEFNFLNKYTRVCEDMYIVKYQEEGNLIYERIESSMLDWMLPARRAFRVGYGIRERLKIKAVQEIKHEFDIGVMIKRLKALEKNVYHAEPEFGTGILNSRTNSLHNKSLRSIPSTIPSSINPSSQIGLNSVFSQVSTSRL